MQHAHASQKTHVIYSLSSQSIGALAEPTENACHVFAIQSVHWHAGWTYRKRNTASTHYCVTSPRTQKNTAPVLLPACVAGVA